MIQDLKQDYRLAQLDPADRAMLDYAVKLTVHPSEMRPSDVVLLREAGFSDGAILDINQITGYYNFVNRLADGLGVELEPYWTEEEKKKL